MVERQVYSSTLSGIETSLVSPAYCPCYSALLASGQKQASTRFLLQVHDLRFAFMLGHQLRLWCLNLSPDKESPMRLRLE